jgi:hypothetical protein
LSARPKSTETGAKASTLFSDARGDDGKNKAGMGGPNSSVMIYNLTIPPINQIAEGQSLSNPFGKERESFLLLRSRSFSFNGRQDMQTPENNFTR